MEIINGAKVRHAISGLVGVATGKNKVEGKTQTNPGHVYHEVTFKWKPEAGKSTIDPKEGEQTHTEFVRGDHALPIEDTKPVEKPRDK